MEAIKWNHFLETVSLYLREWNKINGLFFLPSICMQQHQGQNATQLPVWMSPRQGCHHHHY